MSDVATPGKAIVGGYQDLPVGGRQRLPSDGHVSHAPWWRYIGDIVEMLAGDDTDVRLVIEALDAAETNSSVRSP